MNQRTLRRILLLAAFLAGMAVQNWVLRNDAKPHDETAFRSTKVDQQKEPITRLEKEVDFKTILYGDLREASKYLFALKAPPEIVFDVVRGRIERELLRERAAQLMARGPSVFWNANPGPSDRLLMQAEEYLNCAIISEIIQKYQPINPSAHRNPFSALRKAVLNYKYPFLPSEKGELLEEKRMQLHSRISKLNLDPPLDSRELSELQGIKSYYQTELEALLTPDEKHQHDLFYSPLACISHGFFLKRGKRIF